MLLRGLSAHAAGSPFNGEWVNVDTSRYLIVGGGMTGDSACQGIREHDSEGSIILVGAESHPPYKRPPLSKGLWGKAEEASIWRKTEERGVDLRLGRSIVGLDLAKRVATDDRGDSYQYERLLVATGGQPRRLPHSDAEIVYFRTLDDYRSLRAHAEAGARFVVIGGGFIGSEIAASLASSRANLYTQVVNRLNPRKSSRRASTLIRASSAASSAMSSSSFPRKCGSVGRRLATSNRAPLSSKVCRREIASS